MAYSFWCKLFGLNRQRNTEFVAVIFMTIPLNFLLILLHLMIFVNHFHRFLRFIMIVLELRIDSVVIKRISIVSILLNTLILGVILDEFSNFLLKIYFFLIYVNCLHVGLWTLWSLILNHLIIVWCIICIGCPWRWRRVKLFNWVVPIRLKDRKS